MDRFFIWTIIGALLSSFVVSSNAQAKNILIVGDSMTCGPFGAELYKNLAASPGNSVTVYCTVSSTPSSWVNGTTPAGQKCNTCSGSSCASWIKSSAPDTEFLPVCGATGQVPKFSSILGAKKYDQVIVALGANALPATKVDSTYKQMTDMIKSAGASCDWVGPPHFSTDKGTEAAQGDKSLPAFYDSLSSAVSSECPLLDSRDLTANLKDNDTAPDGEHPEPAAGRAWADGISAHLQSPTATVPTSSGGSPAVQ
jgi:hypothetical protein